MLLTRYILAYRAHNACIWDQRQSHNIHNTFIIKMFLNMHQAQHNTDYMLSKVDPEVRVGI